MTSSATHSHLHVIIQNTKEAAGQVFLALFDNSEDWMTIEKACYQAKKSCSKEDKFVEVIVPDVPHGVYAACVLLDTNNNERMDSNIIGYPIEPFAFSNQAVPTIAGPPHFEQAAFTHDQKTSLNIEI